MFLLNCLLILCHFIQRKLEVQVQVQGQVQGQGQVQVQVQDLMVGLSLRPRRRLARAWLVLARLPSTHRLPRGWRGEARDSPNRWHPAR